MNALEFLKPGRPAEPRPVYALFGDDPYLKHESETAILRTLFGPDPDAMSVARFEGDKASLAEVLDEVRTLPFLAPRRVAIVQDADKFVTAHRKELESYAEHPSSTGTLILVVKVWNAATKLAKLVSAVGLAVECKCPKSNELAGWLAALAKDRHGVGLEPEAGRLLVELVGDEAGLLAQEVEKLAVFVGGKGTIRREDVSRMVGAGRVETIWRTLEAATTGRGSEAIHDLDGLLLAGEHPVGLLAAMSASLRKVHHAGQLRRARVPVNEACREAGIPAYPAAIDMTSRQHTHLGPTRVDALPETLLKADLDLKGSTMLAPRVVIERFLLTLARPRQD